jgi:predicted transcriptional regulator
MIKIEIVQDIKKSINAGWSRADKILRGEIAAEKSGKTIFLTPETFARVFSTERIKIMLMIRKKSLNIYQLAKELNRKYEAVYRDIKLLEGFGMIALEDKGREKIPVMHAVSIPQFAEV